MTTESVQAKTKGDVFTIVTNRIIELLEKGTIPWKQPWKSAGPPRNMITGRTYRGLNILLLASLNYTTNLFLTLKQINELGGRVKKGEHSCPVVFWSQKEQKEGEEKENGKEAKRILRYYSVFNIEQCVDIPENKIPEYPLQAIDSIQICDAVIDHMPNKPKIKTKGSEAFYNPEKDFIQMPPMKVFDNSESYYSVLFHELIHSTGHKSRLQRESVMNFEKYLIEAYSEEELVAQIGACLLNAHTGCEIATFENDVAYIQGWLNRLKGDKRFIVFASAKAQRAVDYILNTDFEESSEVSTS